MKNLVLVLILAITSISYSQEASDDCTKYRGLTGMYAKQKMYRDAANFFVQAYEVCGLEGLLKSDWNNAKIIYKKLIKVEKDATVKAGLTDSLVWIFDNGDTYEDDPKWKADYASLLVKIKSPDVAKTDSLFANSIHRLKDKCSTNHIKYYYTHLVRKFNNNEGEAKEIIRNFAIDEYLVLSDYVGTALKGYKEKGDEKKAGYYIKAQVFLDQYFVKLANDCTILTEVLGKKINDLPKDKAAKIEKVKGYLSILDKRKCTSTDLYGQFADTLILLEPTAAAYYAQGNFFKEKNNISKAKEYYTKAIEMEADGENADKYKYSYANALYTSKSYKAAYRAAKNVGGEFKGDALAICAYSIAATANSCGDTSFERKANYWLANDYAKKASAAGGKISSSKYLGNVPTSEEVFDAGLSMGSSYKLKCWGENTTIR